MGIATELAGSTKDLGGGFVVRRLLPSARQRSVGPFVFFDHFGPVAEVPGSMRCSLPRLSRCIIAPSYR